MGSSGTHVLNPGGEKDCWPLYYRWSSIYSVTIKCFFFPWNSLGKTMRNGAWSEAGSGRDEMSRSLGRIFSLKKRWKKNGSQGLFTCWSMAIDGHLTDWNQTRFSYYEIKCTCSSNNKKIMRSVSHLLYWFKTLQAILHNSWAFFTHFLTLRKHFSSHKIGMAKENKV